MTILETLNAQSKTPGEVWLEPRGHLSGIHHEVAPGCFVFVMLGAAGLQITNGTDTVGIPLDALVKLAQQFEPGLEPKEVESLPTGPAPAAAANPKS